MAGEEPAQATTEMPVERVPAIGASITCNLAEGRQVVLQAFFDRDGDTAEGNAVLDKMGKMIDRQRAKYEIVELERELFIHETQLGQMPEDIQRVEADYQRKVALRKVEAEGYRRAADEALTEGQRLHTQNQRRGDYEPKGVVKSTIQRAEAEIVRVAGQEATDAGERQRALDGLAVSQRRFEEMVIRIKAQLTEKRGLLTE